MVVDYKKGEFLTQEELNEDLVPGTLGSSETDPYLIAPEDWEENGVPYGSWCKCGSCGEIGRSTFSFDFYAKNSGDKFDCEYCMRRKLF